MTQPSNKATPAKKATATKAASATEKATATKAATATEKATATKAAGATKKTTPTKKGTPTKKSTASPKAKSAAKAVGAVESKFFRRATERARRIAGDPQKLRDIAEKAGRSAAMRSGPFAAVTDDFRALIRLVVAYARGHYREIPVDSLVIVVAGLIYVVSPLDLIPDTIPGLGVVDDAAVIGWVIKTVRGELDAFREWEAGATD